MPVRKDGTARKWRKEVNLVCIQCGKVFAATKVSSSKRNIRFCSPKCYNLHRKQKYTLSICKLCGKEFAHKLRKKKPRVYCSHHCQTLNSHQILPIEYKGILFRSSYEVNFAKFLDKHHLEWLYEPKTFKLDESLSYIPDFYIKDYDCWVEIKGKETERHKLQYRLFKEKVSKNFYVIRGGSEFDFIWWIQEVFNRKFFDFDKLDQEQQQNLTKEYVVHLVAEVTEILNTVNWKMHQDKKTNEIIPSQIISEVVDCFKYVMGVCQIWGITSQQFLDSLRKKSKVVELKYCYGRELSKLKDKNVIACDIDGVLNYYPCAFLNYVNKQLKTEYKDYIEAKRSIDPKTLLDLKTQYRESGLKTFEKANDDTIKFLKSESLKETYIILLTARPIDKHPRLYYDTYEWLTLNKVRYDAIYFSKYKHIEIIKKVPNLKYMIEDNLEYANQISSRGFKVYLLNNIYNQGKTDNNVKRINSLLEIV